MIKCIPQIKIKIHCEHLHWTQYGWRVLHAYKAGILTYEEQETIMITGITRVTR